MHMLGSEGGNPHLSLTQPPLSPSLPLICQLRVCRVWASAQVKGSKSGSDSLLGPIGPSTRWPLTFDPFTFYPHYSLKTNHHLIRIRSTHACFPAIACMSDSSIYVPSQTTLKSDWKHPSWGLFFFGSGRDMTHKLFCPPVQIFSGSEGTVFAGGSQRSWWQMYWMMGWTQSKWHAFIPEGRKSAMKAIYVSGKCLIFVCFSCSYVAMFPYTPRKEDELELRKGEMFLVLERCQDGWFKGTSMHTGKIGVFPGNYMSPVSRSGYSYQHTVYTHTQVHSLSHPFVYDAKL